MRFPYSYRSRLLSRIPGIISHKAAFRSPFGVDRGAEFGFALFAIDDPILGDLGIRRELDLLTAVVAMHDLTPAGDHGKHQKEHQNYRDELSYLKYLSKRPFKALPCLASSLAIS